MPPLRLLLFLPLLLLFGCGILEPPQETQAQLALACEMAKCECRSANSAGFSFSSGKPPVAVEWRGDGTASCPVGYLLARQK